MTSVDKFGTIWDIEITDRCFGPCKLLVCRRQTHNSGMIAISRYWHNNPTQIITDDVEFLAPFGEKSRFKTVEEAVDAAIAFWKLCVVRCAVRCELTRLKN